MLKVNASWPPVRISPCGRAAWTPRTCERGNADEFEYCWPWPLLPARCELMGHLPALQLVSTMDEMQAKTVIGAQSNTALTQSCQDSCLWTVRKLLVQRHEGWSLCNNKKQKLQFATCNHLVMQTTCTCINHCMQRCSSTFLDLLTSTVCSRCVSTANTKVTSMTVFSYFSGYSVWLDNSPG